MLAVIGFFEKSVGCGLITVDSAPSVSKSQAPRWHLPRWHWFRQQSEDARAGNGKVFSLSLARLQCRPAVLFESAFRWNSLSRLILPAGQHFMPDYLSAQHFCHPNQRNHQFDHRR
jgi:hypothetical protein